MRRLLLTLPWLMAVFGLAADAAPPVFVAETGAANPLDGVDVGEFSAPVFADLDGDGTLDLVSGEHYGAFFYFENTGTSTSPLFVARTGSASPFDGFDVGEFSAPAFVDLDGDGDLDLVAGEHQTAFHYFENVGTPTAPAFIERTGAANPFDGLTAGSVPEPAFADLDGDGDFDLVAGSSDGTFYYFENIGTPAAPVFVARSGSANPLSGVSITGFSTAAFADVDGDGDLDLVSGAPNGSFHYFENTGTPSVPAFVERTGAANPFAGLKTPAAFSTGSFANLYGDATAAFIGGGADGTFALFRAPEPDAGSLEAAAGSALGLLALRRRR